MNLKEKIVHKGTKILLVVSIIASLLLLIQAFIYLFSKEYDEYLAHQVISTYFLWAMYFYSKYSDKKINAK